MKKRQRSLAIKALLNSFCKKYLNEELEGYAIKLCDIVIEVVEGEEADEIESYAENQGSIMKQSRKEKRERSAEVNRKIVQTRKTKNSNDIQLNLFEDS